VALVELLERYGYGAVLIGTFFEGETVLVMGGFAAHQGYLQFPGVVLAAFCGSLAGDQFAFLLGRRYGHLLERFPRLRPGVERATRLLERRGTWLLLGFRFVYGIRNLTPLAAGLSRIPASRFFALNAVGAALWSLAIGAAGYAFGRGFSLLLERARSFEETALAGVVVLGGAVAALHWFRRFRRARAHPASAPPADTPSRPDRAP
jgi:membrane protein DedA with SNARE-associated domain